MKQAHRFSGKSQPYEGLTRLGANGPIWTGEARFVSEMLDLPLRWKKPQRIFVNSMSDLFHKDVSVEDVAMIFAVFAVAEWHTFQVLTKRADRMAEILGDPGFPPLVARMINERVRPLIDGKIKGDWGLVSPVAHGLTQGREWPLPNVWLGVSVEDQTNANERIPHLLKCPAAVRFLSVEPLLGPVDLRCHWYTTHNWHDWLTGKTGLGRTEDNFASHHQTGQKLDWVIVGGESGPKARPMHPAWAWSVRDQCVAASVPFFFKQQGEWSFDCQPTDADEIVQAFLRNPGGRWVGRDGETTHDGWETVLMSRVGKKIAGRMLDGRTWDEFPKAPSLVH